MKSGRRGRALSWIKKRMQFASSADRESARRLIPSPAQTRNSQHLPLPSHNHSIKMAPLPRLDLVLLSFPPLSNIATSLGSSLPHRELRKLGAYMCTFALETQELSSSQRRDLEWTRDFQDLLEKIEELISVSNLYYQRPFSVRFPHSVPALTTV
jgi:hypothetical protein